MTKLLRLKPVIVAVAVVLATSQLAACFPLMAGAVGAGVLYATDRRNTSTQTIDRGLQLEAEGTLASRYSGQARVNVTVYNRKMLLTGEARDDATRTQIDQYARGLQNVREVINELRVSSSPSLLERSEDTYITSKVKASLVATKEVPSNSIKVTTEVGVVYLLGVVTEPEGEAATQVARSVSGVTKVVKAFDYISEDEKRRLDAQSTSQPTADSRDTSPGTPAPVQTVSPGTSISPATSAPATSPVTVPKGRALP
jgi:osmotically-inducible protein OsmY